MSLERKEVLWLSLVETEVFFISNQETCTNVLKRTFLHRRRQSMRKEEEEEEEKDRKKKTEREGAAP